MENDVDSQDSRQPSYYVANKGYALSGRIMLSSIVILFFVVILMVCLHLYGRWYLVPARRRQLSRNRRRRTHFVFYVDPANPSIANSPRGLDASVLKALPVFVYSSKTHADAMDCAVCLCEFEENESGRVLPKCNHTFHIDCIDMWFHSHSTCPLCRSPVESVTGPLGDTVPPENPVPVRVAVREPGSSSEAEPAGPDSSVSQGSSIVSSVRKMLAREKKGNSTSSGNDVDIERGRGETHR